MNVGEDECDDAPEVSGSSNSVVRRQAASSLTCITTVGSYSYPPLVGITYYPTCFYLYSFLKHYLPSRISRSSATILRVMNENCCLFSASYTHALVLVVLL